MSATSARNLKLTAAGDLSVTAGQLDLVSGAEAVAQAIRTALQLFRGEWFLDTSLGVPYFEDILRHSPNLTVVRAIIRGVVLGVVGVASISTLQLDYDPDARTLLVTLGVLTDMDELATVNLQLGVP